MQGGFERFRKKQTCVTIINSVIWGIAAALFAVGALLLISKLTKQSIHVVFYVTVPILAYLLASVLGYFVFYQCDRKLAKRMDEEFALNDRVQTMVEFKHVQTDMVYLQREDALTRLDNLPVSQLKWRGFWVCVASFVCAIVLFVTGLVLPKPKMVTGDTPSGGGGSGEILVTDNHKTKLATLIKEVKSSKAEDAVKNVIVPELEALLLLLDEYEEAVDAIEIYLEVAGIITRIDQFVEEHNTYKRIYDAIRSTERETIQQFAIGIGFISLGVNDLPGTFEDMKASFQNEDENNVLTLAAVTAFAVELKVLFAEVDESEEDALMIAIPAFITQMLEVGALDPATYSYNKVLSYLDAAFNDNVKALSTALEQQMDNRKVTDNTIERLIAIFSIPAEWIPEWGGRSLEGLGGDIMQPEDEEQGSGIIIDGVVYPSAESVYDYYTKVICEYGKVFEGDVHNYKREINALIAEGVADGTISPEVEEMLRSYLDALSGKDLKGND